MNGVVATPHPVGPCLVLAAGQRCGSTLLQRLLASHPEMMVWGEHAGQLRALLALSERLRVWADSDGARGRSDFAIDAHQSFMANLMPPAEQVDAAVRAFLTTLFVDPAVAAGRHRWGIKEVRYGLPEARALTRIFPGCRVVHIVRDPRDVLRSLDVWERAESGWRRADTEIAIRDWSRVAQSFLGSAATDSPPVLTVRYEEVVDDPAGSTDLIARHVGLDPLLLDVGVFDRRIHTDGPRGQQERSVRRWSELPSSLQSLLDDEEVILTATSLGYDLQSPCG